MIIFEDEENGEILSLSLHNCTSLKIHDRPWVSDDENWEDILKMVDIPQI